MFPSSLENVLQEAAATSEESDEEAFCSIFALELQCIFCWLSRMTCNNFAFQLQIRIVYEVKMCKNMQGEKDEYQLLVGIVDQKVW